MVFRSIRWQLVASYVLLTLLVVGLLGVLALAQVKRNAEQQELQYLTENAQTVVRQSLPFIYPQPHPYALHNLAVTSSFLSNVQVRILDARQQVLADSGIPGGDIVWAVAPNEHGGAVIITSIDQYHQDQLGVPSLSLEFPPGTQYGVVRRESHIWGDRFVFEEWQTQPSVTTTAPQAEPAQQEAPRSLRSVTIPIGDPNRPVGYVELSNGPDFGAEATATTRRAILYAAAGTGMFALLLGLLMSRRLTAPLSSLTLATGRMSSGDLSARAAVRREDEIGELGRQFNSMAERLETSFAQLAAERDALRRFIADASHELRTPITALKTFQELLDEKTADDPTARQEFLLESRAQIRRLEWITRNLLDLSRFDAGLIHLETAQHDVEEILMAAASAFRTLAQERDIRLVIEPPQPEVTLECDRARIELALSNLLENALKFSGAGGMVRVSAEPEGELLRIWVRDGGPGIPAEDQPHIFERFYRGRSTLVGGSGLGLAIVKSVVELHRGRVWVESDPGSGSAFALELPLLVDSGQRRFAAG